MSDSLTLEAIELLTRGHNLYGGAVPDAGLADAPELRRHAERFIRATTRDGIGIAVPATLHAAADLRGAAGADTALATVLSDTRAEHALGHHATRTVLDDACGDLIPGADTPLGRREALRRMAARLRTQRQHIRRSHWLSRLLAQRLRRLAYLRRRRAAQALQAPAARAIPLSAVRYQKSSGPGYVAGRIAAALNHMGITDPQGRRNWLHGYQTLIARESGGLPSAVAAESATASGPRQSDGHGLGFARGLTQTIPATFAHYHQPGTSTDIYDPVANICASMNYVMHRYGVSRDGENLVALVQQADARRPPKGY
jgi:SLT domain-containing protein